MHELTLMSPNDFSRLIEVGGTYEQILNHVNRHADRKTAEVSDAFQGGRGAGKGGEIPWERELSSIIDDIALAQEVLDVNSSSLASSRSR
jgi:hypothetical protein